jgi:hypothetical protein
MRLPSRLAAAGLTLLGLIGLSAAGARPQAPEPKRLDAEATVIRLLLGVGDDTPRSWIGRVSVDRGEVLDVEGWRFRAGDRQVDSTSWEAKSLRIRKTATKPKAKKDSGPGTSGAAITPTGVLATLKSPKDAVLTLQTERGNARVPLADLADGSPRRFLNGQVEARRVPPHAPLLTGPLHEDFPAAAPDALGGVWVAYVVHEPFGPEVSEALTSAPTDFSSFVPKGGGDQIQLVRYAEGRPGAVLHVTEPGRDVWRPAVAVDGRGRVHVVWSEFRNRDWDLFHRAYDPASKAWSDSKRLTTALGTDTDAVLATTPDGQVWMAWQNWSDGQADLFLAAVESNRRLRVTDTAANEWAPALAVTPNGTVHVAFDTYETGDYNVKLIRFTPGVGFSRALAIAGSPRFEARPSLAVDSRGRAWIAYEERDSQWGKDAENLIEGEGSSLYRSSAVKVVCVEGDTIRHAPDPVANAPEGERRFNSHPRVIVDASGRVWLTYRHRQEAIWGGNAVMVVGGVWVSHVTSLAGPSWSVPQPIPCTDNLLDNRPALVAVSGGPVLLFASGDGRLRREVEHDPDLSRRYYSHSGTPPGVVNNDLFVAALASSAAGTSEPALGRSPVETIAAEPPVHPDEPEDVARMRRHRIRAAGKTYQLLRGEFHRHTEISQDGGSDGSLEDMWRYALDAGRLDWIGNGDHDNGGGKEYTWWLTQKTTDLYHVPTAFVPMFTYERSVGYPGGHRNVMFPYRGVRTLPRLVDENGVRTRVRGVDEDARMLYRYLNQLGGICAMHTSATGMGTDWRANDPKAEPFVEIFQGHRQSYEYLGAPRSALRKEDSIGGWQPLGMVWNALAMQYRLGFQASSDHISTHISFAIAIAEEPTREAIFDAFRRRHCYGATDNILLDVRCGDHLMGDEFIANGPVKLKVLAHGAAPIKQVDIIKDFRFVYTSHPGTPRVEFAWTDDEERSAGLSWYYVRIQQEDGEIAWGSPMWVHSAAQAVSR